MVIYRKRSILAVIITVTILIGVGITAYHFLIPTVVATVEKAKERIKIGGSFTLVNHEGRIVTDRDFLGRYLLVYFGYTFCPDICPTALHTMMAAYSQLTPGQQEQIVPLFITVDAKRDTIEQIKSYVTAFHPSLIGLTGTVEQVTAAAKSYKVFFSETELPNTQNNGRNYFVDHSSIIYLIDPAGQYCTHFWHNSAVQELSKTLRNPRCQKD